MYGFFAGHLPAVYYEAPYGTKLILFYRRDVFHSDSHFTNRNDGFYLSQWWTLLIELKVSIISIAFLSIDRCTHRNFHIDRTIKKHRLIDVTYRSIDTKGPSIDTKGPSIDTKGPSIDAKGPSIDRSIRRVHRDRYEGSIDRYEGSVHRDRYETHVKLAQHSVAAH